MTEQYTPTTEQVRLDYVMAYSEKESSQILAERDFDRWLAEYERQVAEKAWWEACLRIADGENHLDIAHVYQKQNPYLDAALGLTAEQEGENDG